MFTFRLPKLPKMEAFPPRPPATKTVTVRTEVPEADGYGSTHEIIVQVTVPYGIPDTDLKPIAEAATDWCKKMAESLSTHLWRDEE